MCTKLQDYLIQEAWIDIYVATSWNEYWVHAFVSHTEKREHNGTQIYSAS